MVKLAYASIRMHKVFPGSPLPLEWLCKVFLEWSADALESEDSHAQLEENVFGINVIPPISSYIKLLLDLNGTSTLAKLANGANNYKNGSYNEARYIIMTTFSESQKSATNFHATYVLCQCLEKLCDYIECEVYTHTVLLLLEEKVKDA